MRTFCIKSGVIISQDNCLDNLGLGRNKLTKVSEHLVFGYPLKDLLTMATHKPFEKLSTKQRHLLAVAIVDKCCPIDIYRPINSELLPPDKLLSLFPMIIEAGIRVASMYDNWLTVKAGMPRMEVRLDNFTELNLMSYIKNIFFVETHNLLFTDNLSTIQARKANMLDEEINFEIELKQQIKQYDAKRKNSTFSPKMGKFVLAILTKELKNTPTPITNDFRDIAYYIFNTTADKISRVKIGKAMVYVNSDTIARLRNLIVTYSKFTIAPEDTLARAYTAITVRHLDSKLDYFQSVVALFGIETEEVLVDLEPEYPIEYSIKQMPKIATHTKSTVIPPPKNPEVANSTNSLIKRILAKRAAAAASKGGTND